MDDQAISLKDLKVLIETLTDGEILRISFIIMPKDGGLSDGRIETLPLLRKQSYLEKSGNWQKQKRI